MPGTIRKIYNACCYECHETVTLDRETMLDAKKQLRAEYDWSLGRDLRWRCAHCRPARFGEGTR